MEATNGSVSDVPLLLPDIMLLRPIRMVEIAILATMLQQPVSFRVRARLGVFFRAGCMAPEYARSRDRCQGDLSRIGQDRRKVKGWLVGAQEVQRPRRRFNAAVPPGGTGRTF